MSELSNSASQDVGRLNPSRYVFSPPFPKRSLLILGLLAVLGVVLLVVSQTQDSSVLMICAIALLVVTILGIALCLLSVRAAQLRVELDDRGYRINNGGDVRSGTWADVTSVSATPDGQRLVIRRGEIERDFIIAPQGDWQQRMAELTSDLERRLSVAE